jgi:hypothetical protein
MQMQILVVLEGRYLMAKSRSCLKVQIGAAFFVGCGGGLFVREGVGVNA